MAQAIPTALLWFSALSCGLLAGVYFAFSAFVMSALGRIGPQAGIAAMNAINAVIVRSAFMPLFLGSSLASLILAGLAVLRWQEPGAAMALAGGALHVLGMFVCTMVCNVPLNNALAAADPSSAGSADFWARYLKDWTFWNHVRAVASTAAFVLFIAALAAR